MGGAASCEAPAFLGGAASCEAPAFLGGALPTRRRPSWEARFLRGAGLPRRRGFPRGSRPSWEARLPAKGPGLLRRHLHRSPAPSWEAALPRTAGAFRGRATVSALDGAVGVGVDRGTSRRGTVLGRASPVSAVTARAPDTGDGGARTTCTYAVRQNISISVLTVLTTHLARCHALCVTHVTVGTSYDIGETNRTLGGPPGPRRHAGAHIAH